MNKVILKRVVAISLLAGAMCCHAAGQYEDRWFYVSRNLTKQEHVREIANIVKTAKAADLNGMLFACGVERWNNWPADRRKRLVEVKHLCDAAGIEIIPVLWSVGYGGHDPAYAAALPCTGVKFTVKGGKAVFAGGGAGEFANAGFDDPTEKPNRAPGWEWTDKPGEVSFIDTDVKASGTASLRMEKYGDNEHGHGRACHRLKVGGAGRFKVSCKIKTEGVDPTSELMMQVYAMDGRRVSAQRPNLPSSQDWTTVECMFDSAGEGEFRVYAGIWGGKTGRFWLDDFKVEDMGCAPPLLREELPFTVRDAKTGAELRAGVDYELPPQNVWNKKWNSFRLVRGRVTREGTELVVDYWTAAVVAGSQRPCCMSSPALYDYYRTSAAAVKSALNPRKWFLSMDEIRAGGTCPLCLSRGQDMAHQLGECVTRQREIIKTVRPDAQIYIWSDMIDPAHNAHDNYYSCRGTFDGAWKHIPKDIVISCWYDKKHDVSMPFFSKLGFRTQAAAFYDADDLESTRAWLGTCNRTPGCTGIMYTTWRDKYKLLPQFGELVRKESDPSAKLQ
jgi:hypothetical protein